MGRKSKEKDRKALTPKAKVWLKQLVPLLHDQQLDKLTLDELAELMGKSKSTIYSYFSTKEEIYQAAVQLVLDDMAFIISREAIEGENMEVVLRNLLLEIGAGIEGVSISLLGQLQLYFPEIWNTITEFTDQLLENFQMIYEAGMRQGVFREYNLQLLLSLDRHFIMSIMTDSKQFSAQGLTLKELVTEYLELRLQALRNP